MNFGGCLPTSLPPASFSHLSFYLCRIDLSLQNGHFTGRYYLLLNQLVHLHSFTWLLSTCLNWSVWMMLHIFIQWVLFLLFSSVTQSCPTLCDTMDCSAPTSPSITNSQSQQKLTSILSVMPSNHLILCHPLLPSLQSFPASGPLPVSQFFALGGQSIGVSASASVLPMNIQDWFPLGWTGWIPLQFKALSRVFFSTTIQKHQFFGAQLTL